MIQDSGTRRTFISGAVRDIQEGKGRCDLLPLDVIGTLLNNPTFGYINEFMTTGNPQYLYSVLQYCGLYEDYPTMILEVSKHFEEGAAKYGENNWQKGIPVHCYIDSAVRRYLKWLRGDKDEPHDRAFVWNIMCCIWEVDYHEEDK
jgi:hypothetical protein